MRGATRKSGKTFMPRPNLYYEERMPSPLQRVWLEFFDAMRLPLGPCIFSYSLSLLAYSVHC